MFDLLQIVILELLLQQRQPLRKLEPRLIKKYIHTFNIAFHLLKKNLFCLNFLLKYEYLEQRKRLVGWLLRYSGKSELSAQRLVRWL